MSDLHEKLLETTRYLREQGVVEVDVALILGSGLGELAEEIEKATIIKYDGIPNFPVSTVQGHAGQLVYGELSGKKVLAMQGRFHFYEGYPMSSVTFPVRVFASLGVESLIVTNAAGGVGEHFTPGDLMLITDHMNFMGTNPLIGPNDEKIGVRFPDMSQAYDAEYGEIAQAVAKELSIELQKGVYMGLTGPTYETPAEIRMARVLGASAVGMSTVPEVIVGVHSGLRVLGISCITNLAAGMQSSLNHEEVVETTERVKEDFKALVRKIIGRL
ncbi:MAG: purine-nucleoside phosphorylase [Streptococcaceae bacterium]|jgi:purine-nucleoside phosphorylase|nr:purine-nucleoside phosphorylase [Streptococcaceae bacterium]